ncbi:MAG: hypothetical protein H6635_02600 [Anaerolineales bacterium]|nr:hypothetical protein [Anaerolineales bacterium]MCB9144231.1 hypothetical protein [Anaerolineales bacterium]
MKVVTGFFLLFLASIFLSACKTPQQPITELERASDLAIIEYAHVEVGMGSPTPVAVTVDVHFEKACSQIKSIEQVMTQEHEFTRIQINILVMEFGETCTEFPQTFRMVVPINASGLGKGIYRVEVNSVDAGSFEFKH